MSVFDGQPQFEVRLKGRRIKLPIFYRDVKAVLGLFPARAGKLAQKLPSGLKLSRVAPGISLLGIAVFKYEDSDVGKYNEVAVAIPTANLPLPVQFARFELHSFIWKLPVTTKIAFDAGVEFWGYPKFVAGISFDEDENFVSSTLLRDEVVMLRVRARKTSRFFKRTVRFVTYSVKDGYTVRGDVLADVLFGVVPFGMEIEECEREISEVLLSRKSVFYMYIARMQSILYPPVKV